MASLLLASMPALAAADDQTCPTVCRSVLNVRHVPDSTLSIYVENVETGDADHLTWNDREPRNPASVEKMLDDPGCARYIARPRVSIGKQKYMH